jgi:glycosyltransferase involved in cell wall biosynthesis
MNQATPRVSVVMPFLNPGPYFTPAIESVLAQDYEDYELILVDDGSTDGSTDIAAQYAHRLPDRIIVLGPDASRRGAAHARNRGIDGARGSLIAFLDADDLYLPDKLRHDVDALDANPDAAWVYSATRWFHEGQPYRNWTDRLGLRLNRCYLPPELIVRVLLEDRGDVPCTCAVMIRREPLLAVGGFHTGFALYEDQALWAKLLLAYPVRVTSGCRAWYRQHDRSSSALATTRGEYARTRAHPARHTFLAWLADYARANDAPAAVIESVHRAMRDTGGWVSQVRRKLRRLARFFPR